MAYNSIRYTNLVCLVILWPGLLKLEFIWGKDAKVMVGAIGIEPTAPCTSIRDPFFTSSKLTI